MEDEFAEGGKSRLRRISCWRTLHYDGLPFLVTIAWGSAFVIVQDAVKLTRPFTFLFIRFGIGALVLALVFRKHFTRLTRTELITGSLIGVCLFAAYALQTTGLQYTTTSKAGFITGLYVPFVAVLSFPFLGQKLALGAIMGVLLSLAGLTLLSVNTSFQLAFGLGELLVLGCALANALHIVSISKFVPHADAINLAMIQIALTSLLSFLAILLAKEPLTLPPLPVWEAALYTGVVNTAFALVVMNWVQQFVSSTRVTLIYALEPVWAAFFGYLLVGESLSLFSWIGCGLIFLGMIVGGERGVGPLLSSFSILRKHAFPNRFHKKQKTSHS